MQSETTPLRDVCTLISRGITPSYVEDGTLILNQKCIRDGRILLESSRRTNGKIKKIPQDKFIQTFDILVNSTGQGTLGRVAQVEHLEEIATVDSHVTIVRPDKSKIAPEFLGFAMRLLQPEIELMAAGSTGQTELSRDRLGSLNIPLPPLPEQRAIARVLASLDDKIELNRRTNATLEALAQTLFRAWFVDFVPVKAKAAGELPPSMDAETAALFPSQFQESTLGLIPEGWEVKTVSEIAEINGWTLGKNDNLKSLRYIEISEVTRGDIRSITEYSFKDAPSRARRRLRHGDTVLSTVRPDRGAYFLSLNPAKDLIASTGFAVVTPTSAPWSIIHAALTQNEMSDYLGNLADGGAYPAVRPDVIGKWNLVLPKNALLEKFHELCAPLYEKIEMNRSQSQTLAALRDVLLPRLISGRLRVPDALREIVDFGV